MQSTTFRPARERQAIKSRPFLGYWLIVFMLFLLPLERWVFPLNIKVADFSLVVLTLYGFIVALLANKRIYFPLFWPMWCVIMGSLVATLIGLGHIKSIIALIQEIYLFFWFVALTNILIDQSKPTLNGLMKIWSLIASLEAMAVIMGALGIVAFFYTDPTGRIISAGGFHRGTGTFANPNAAAAYLAISFFVLLGTSWPTWVRFFLGLLMVAGMFASGSVGAMGSTAISFSILVIFNSTLKHPGKSIFWGAFFCFITASIIMLFLTVNFQPLISTWGGKNVSDGLLSLTLGRFEGSLESRTDLIRDIWPVYRRHIFGIGPNASSTILGTLHNDYVAFLVERGPLGLLGWLWIVLATVFTPFRSAVRQPDLSARWMIMVLGAGFLAIAINALSHEVSHFRQVWVLMAFIFAVCYSTSEHIKQR